MITTTYNYSSGSGFVYDAAKIGFVSNMAQLILVDEPGQTFVPTISASTYDSALLTNVGGTLEQVDQRPPTATFYSAWSSQINANWSSGSSVVTPFNGAVVVGNVLNLTGNTNRYVSFPATGNTNSHQTGTIEFQFTPNYSGGAATIQFMFSICNTGGGSANSIITCFHHPNAGSPALFFRMNDASGNNVVNIAGGWVPTAGTTYNFRFIYDGTAGSTSMYIDGTLFSIASTATYTRGDVQLALIGVDNNITGNSNFSISNFAFYTTVVTPTSPVLSPTIYPAATAVLPEFTYGGLGDVQAYTSFVATDSGVPSYTLNGLYWNGTGWVSSNGTYVQANDSATVNTHITSLPVVDTLQIDALFQAQNTPQSSLSAVTVGYTGQIYPITNPSISPNTSLSMDALSEFIAVLSASGSDGILFNLKIGAIRYWWSGSAWVVSNGTYAQSNTAADIQTNAGSLPIDTGAFVTPYALLHSADGTTTPMLTSLTLTYDYFGPEPSPPDVCKVFGYILDENEVPIVGATVSVTNETTFINGGVVIAQGVRTVKTNSFGYFSMNLVETATMPVPALLTFSVAYTSLAPGGVGPGFTPTTFTFGGAVIPDVPEANIASFTFQ